MNPETLKALKESIAHWRRLATGKRRKGETHYGDDCSLCHKFYTGDGKCSNCPVAKKTGHGDCQGSPWWKAHQAYLECGFLDTDSRYNSESFKAAAKNELTFLVSLLPKAKRK